MKKAQILRVVESMPDDVTLTELFRRLRVLEEIERGESSLISEGGVRHVEVQVRFGILPTAGPPGGQREFDEA